MALTQSNGMPIGTEAPDFDLLGVDGERWCLARFAEAKALVVVFTCNHCPYAQACEARLIALQRDYAAQGVALVAINPNDARRYPDDDYPAMQQRARDQGFNFPYLHDESQAVARAYDAACTPDIFVFDTARRLAYNGRLDDNWKDESAVQRRDLRLALDRVLAGEPVDFDVIPSMGCSIKWRPTA
ncbi:MAG: thioredoxin family protein [Polyangiales bacterium]